MTHNEARGLLMIKGFTLSSWAVAHGYRPNSVIQTLKRYVGSDSKPQLRGIQTRAILCDLSRTIGKPVIPGLPLDSTTPQS